MQLSSLMDGIGILPVMCLKSEGELETFAEALAKTPVKCIEITMRHPFSYTAIPYIKKNYPQYTVAAGTVMDPDTMDRVLAIGADLCVAPGLDPALVAAASARGVPFIPGVATPTEISHAMRLGLDTVKLFPAEAMGGVGVLKLYESAFAGMHFVPTGGITAENYIAYLSQKNVAAVGGSFMIPRAALASGDADAVAASVNHYVEEYRREVK